MTTDVRGVVWPNFGEPNSRTRKDPRWHRTQKEGKPPKNYFCILPDMFSITETNSCICEQSHKLTVNLSILWYITVWQAATLSSLSTRINSPGHSLCPCSRTSNLHYYDIFKPESSRSTESEDGAPILRTASQPVTRERARRAAVLLQPPVRLGPRCQRAQGTGAWPWILLRIRAGSSNTPRKRHNF